MNDPVIGSILIGIRRVVLFVVVSLVIGSSLWLTMLVRGYQATFSNLWPWTVGVWDGHGDFFATALFYGSYALGFLLVVVMFLLAALWWRGRGDTLHRRGPQIVDGRQS